MTWAQVARKDFEDAVRSKMLWGLMGVFVAFMAFVLVVAINTADAAEATSEAALALTANFAQLFVPLIAMIAGYLAVVGERRSGSLRILLGYPHSRRDVVFGKFVGRSTVIAVTLAIGSAVSILLVALVIKSPDLANVAGLLTAIVLFGISVAGLAVGISASVTSRGKAMALAIGSMLVFWLLWDAMAAGVYAAVTGSLPGLTAEGWYFLLKRMSPIGAFRTVAEGFVGGRVPPIFRLGIEEIPPNTPSEQLVLSKRVAGQLPFYLKNWFGAVTLAAWGVVPTLVGYLRFKRLDL
ncbi:MAG: ABC-2 type transport system permease protein [Natronomonas sp.]|jgi:ABC-2 type transport system permease protein